MPDNPLLKESWDRPFGLPPFDEITDNHYEPAYDHALDLARIDIAGIAENSEPADFANTIEAMERADRLLDRIGGVFWNLSGSNSTPEIEELERTLSPRLTAFESEVLMNQRLFARISEIKLNCDSLDLTDEQRRVVDLYHRMFVRSGAALDEPSRERLAAIMERARGTRYRVFAESARRRARLDNVPLGTGSEGLSRFRAFGSGTGRS